EGARHEVPRGAEVKTKTLALEQGGTAANHLVLFEKENAMPLAGEQCGGGEPRDAAPDNDGATHRVPAVSDVVESRRSSAVTPKERARTKALMGAETRTLRRYSSSTDVFSTRS